MCISFLVRVKNRKLNSYPKDCKVVFLPTSFCLVLPVYNNMKDLESVVPDLILDSDIQITELLLNRRSPDIYIC